jgi:hypothetical protein
MNLLQNILENFLDVKLALAPWIKVLFYFWIEEKVDREGWIPLKYWCIGTLTIE